MTFHLCLLTLAQETEEYYPGKKEAKAKQKSDIIDKRIELLAETSEGTNFDLTTVFDQLYYLLDHPINLNFTNKEELQLIEFLNDFQINNLLAHIERNGKLMTIYELQAIPGYDLEIIQAILPFIKVNTNLDSPNLSIKEMISNGNHELFIRYTRVLEEMEGYSQIEDSVLLKTPNSRYLGSPDKVYTRYRFKYGTNVSIGVTGEKDPGEEFFKGTQKQGFDFYSAHAFIKNIGRIKKLAIGDYQLTFGQGLTLWSARAFGKSADVINLKRNPVGIKPYTSVDENLFMRGVAGSTEIGKFEITGFYSQNGRDAAPEKVITSSDEVSLRLTGNHRTPKEIAAKKLLTMTHLGTHVAYQGKNLELGSTAIYFNNSIGKPNLLPTKSITKESTLYSQVNIGFDYNYVIRNFNFFGEISKSIGGGGALTSGVLASLDPRLSIIILYRNFSSTYNHSITNPVRESNTDNQKGLYTGIQAKVTKSLSFSTYVDRFSFPEPKYLVNGPSNGVDYLAQLTWKPSKKLEMYVRYQQETKGRNGRPELTDTTTAGIIQTNFIEYNGLKEVVDVDLINLRYNLKYKVSDAISLQSRVQYNRFQLGSNSPSNGFLIFQDIVYKPLSKPYSFNARFALFDTESFDSRIYAYENDVLYGFSIPAYYNRGSRFYINFKYRVAKGIDVWLRIAQTYYTRINNQTSYGPVNGLGTGLENINGNTKTVFKAQVRFKL